MYKAVFLDRDGVINESIVRDGRPYPPASLDELRLIVGVKDALHDLKALGFLLIVVSNQPDVARGKTSKKTVEDINDYLKATLPIDDFFICFHDDSEGCTCRKPAPGSILSAAKKYDIDLESSFMVGDRWRDIDAGLSAQCKTFFIDYKYEEKRPENYDYLVRDLSDVVMVIKELNCG